MKNYVYISNEYYKLLIPVKLKSFGEEVLNYSTEKIKKYFTFFKENKYKEQIKGAFLLNNDDFIARIKMVSSEDVLPPSWARGCFYGGECQVLLDENNPKDMFTTLAHETFHLLFDEFVYKKNGWERIIWLDESLACNFDGSMSRENEENNFQEMLETYFRKDKLPIMSSLDFKKGNIKTKEYNGYHLFEIVGKYLVETKNNEELLKYINDKKQILRDGENILEKSLDYFKKNITKANKKN